MSHSNSVNLTEQERSLGALLRLPYEALQRKTYSELARSGFPEIRPAHGSVFRYILPGGSRVTDLADRAGMTKQSMAYLVDYLAGHGYVRIEPDPDDGRAKIVCLTRRGVAVQRAALDSSKLFERNLARLIGQRSLTRLRTLLGELCDQLASSSGSDGVGSENGSSSAPIARH